VDRLIDSGKTAGEKLWQMPLIEEYKDELKSSAADLKNVGGRWGRHDQWRPLHPGIHRRQASLGHIDIAGPSGPRRNSTTARAAPPAMR
jgi:leucyl aminopeptidase